MSLPTHPSRGDILWKLPTELKDMVFNFVATDTEGDKDIRISLAVENASYSPDARLNAPVVTALLSMKEASRKTYDEMLEYVEGLRWVFVSKTQPHRFLLRAFQHKAPMDLQNSIKHACLDLVTLKGYLDPAELKDGYNDYCFRKLDVVGPFPQDTEYQKSVVPYMRNYDVRLIKHLEYQVLHSMLLFRSTFTSLTKVDIGLDIAEFVPTFSYSDDFSGRAKNFSRRWFDANLTIPVLDLRHLRNITDVDIRIFWNDFLHKGPDLPKPFKSYSKEDAQKILIEGLQVYIRAKSITGHRIDGHRIN